MKLIEIESSWAGVGPLPTLYSKTAKGAVNVWNCWVEGPTVVVEWGQQGGAQQVARFDCLPKNTGKKNATTAEQQAVAEALSKWKKQIKKKYSVTLETAGETKRIKPMLAGDFDKHGHKLNFPVSVQPKLDGCRAIVYWTDHGTIEIQSRGGEIYNLPHLERELECKLQTHENIVLDGELYVHGMSLQELNKLIRKSRPESVNLQYHIYDVVDETKTWSERREMIYDLPLGGTEKLSRVVTLEANNREDILRIQKDFVEAGYEGAIVRSHKGMYREGYRSPDLLKVKSWQDSEFTVVGWTTGKGKFQNVPIFKCLTGHGDGTFDVTPKGTAEERAEMLANADSYIGKLMKVKYFCLSPDDQVPLYPVGLGIRDPSDM